MPSTLEERLHRMRESAKDRMPAETRAVMHRATADLEASGQANRAIGVGDRAPDFELIDSAGGEHSLAAMLQDGPVVLTWFRGHW